MLEVQNVREFFEDKPHCYKMKDIFTLNPVQNVSFIIWIFGTHCKDFFEIIHNVKILNGSLGFWEKLSLGTASILRSSIHPFHIISS